MTTRCRSHEVSRQSFHDKVCKPYDYLVSTVADSTKLFVLFENFHTDLDTIFQGQYGNIYSGLWAS